MSWRLWVGEKENLGTVAEIAGRVTAACQSLHRLFVEPAARANLAVVIRELRQEVDTAVHDLVARLDQTVISSTDHEVIHWLGVTFRALIDSVDGIARRAETFKVADVREPAVRLSQTLAHAAEHLEAGVTLSRQGKEARQYCVEVKALQEQGDAIYYDALTSLFAAPPEVGVLLKWKELYDRLEEALDRAQRVAHLLESFAVKHR